MKHIYFLLVLSATFAISSCSKQNANPEVKLTPEALQSRLLSSPEYASYIQASNNITEAVDVMRLQSSSKTAGNYTKEFYTQREVVQIVQSLPINSETYFKNREVMLNAVKSFQQRFKISNEELANTWYTVIVNNPSSFKSSKPSLPNIPGIIDCITNAGTTFAATTVICLALREIPFIGEALYRACEMEAIDNLIADLRGCIQI